MQAVFLTNALVGRTKKLLAYIGARGIDINVYLPNQAVTINSIDAIHGDFNIPTLGSDNATPSNIKYALNSVPMKAVFMSESGVYLDMSGEQESNNIATAALINTVDALPVGTKLLVGNSLRYKVSKITVLQGYNNCFKYKLTRY